MNTHNWILAGFVFIIVFIVVYVITYALATRVFRNREARKVSARMAQNAIMTPNEIRRIDSRVIHHYDSSKKPVLPPLWAHWCSAAKALVYLGIGDQKCPVCGMLQTPGEVVG